jgi:adenylate cyclase
MTTRLGDLQACFEGVIPSILATSAADGTPNISYLSHVVLVDDQHVALSNQFFAKTAANIRANPSAALLLVDARNGAQFRLEVAWVRSLESGPLFERVSTHLQASSAQVGMAGVMRLRAVDIFRVATITAVVSAAVASRTPVAAPAAHLPTIARITKTIADQTDVDGVVSAMLEGVLKGVGCDHAIVLLNDEERGLLTTVASLGYDSSGIGSEVTVNEGLIGAAVMADQPVRVSDMSRVRRFGAAVEASSADENRTRVINLPGLPDAMSQIAVPMSAQGSVIGALFAESRRRLAFADEQEALLEMIARQGAIAIMLNERLASEARPARIDPPAVSIRSGRTIHIVHHRFDDSVFIDNIYIIKGVAGRLLAFMLEVYRRDGRTEFTNREIRLSGSIRLPEIKDNLETRLLLLRRRLEEKAARVRLVHSGRGQVRLEIDGKPEFVQPD